jgi:excisionase family DNA binding protein
MMTAPLLRTPEEAATLLRCTASWLREKARRREIPFVMVSGSYRFSNAHLERIIHQFEQQPRQPVSTAARRPRSPTPNASNGVTQLRSRPPRRRAS